VSGAGDALTALLITTNPTCDSLWRTDVRQGEEVMVQRRSRAHIDEELFFEYISQVFIPYVTSIHNTLELADESAVLLIGFALLHISDRVLRLLGEKNVVVFTFPAHITNRLQAWSLYCLELSSV
jgi:hypothetical protein